MSPINKCEQSLVTAIAETSDSVKLRIIIVLFDFSISDKKTEPSLNPVKIAFSFGNGSTNVTSLLPTYGRQIGSRPAGPSPSNGQQTASFAPDVAKYFELSTKEKLLTFAPYPDIAESILSFKRQK